MPSSSEKIHEFKVPNWALKFTHLAQTEQMGDEVHVHKEEKVTTFSFEAENGVTESNNIFNRPSLFLGKLLLLKIPHDAKIIDSDSLEEESKSTTRFVKGKKPTEVHLVAQTKNWKPGESDSLDLERMNALILERDFKEIERIITDKSISCGLRETPLSRIPEPSSEMQMFMAINAKDIQFIKSFITDENRHLVDEPMIGHEFGNRPLFDIGIDNDYELFATLIAMGADASKTCGNGRRQSIVDYFIESDTDTDPDIISLARSSITHRNALEIIGELDSLMQPKNNSALKI